MQKKVEPKKKESYKKPMLRMRNITCQLLFFFNSQCDAVAHILKI